MGLRHDTLRSLNLPDSLSGRLKVLHRHLKLHRPFISRIAVALYDNATGMLRTFVYSSDVRSPLTNYQARLSDCTSLSAMLEKGQTRVINDLAVLADSRHVHTKIIHDAGYRSSYTVPMIWEGNVLGFVFFNANDPNMFGKRLLSELDVIAHMVTLLIYHERSHFHTLLATIKSAWDMTNSRDSETGSHIARMSRYAQIIALDVAKAHGLDDQYVEYVFLFAPLHDIGKIKIPDSILLKKGHLTPEEFEIMKTHTQAGAEMIDTLLRNFGLNELTHVSNLRNIALYHHEAWNGKGYPEGLIGQQIPLEARIVAVADVFDALTSKRPYKDAWTNDAAFEELRKLADVKLDRECVEALVRHRDQIELIQRRYAEDLFGSPSHIPNQGNLANFPLASHG